MTWLLFLRANWRLLLPLAIAALVLGSLAYARHKGEEAQQAKAAVKVAERQVEYEQQAGKIEVRRSSNTAKIHETAYEARDAVKSAPDIDTAIADYLAGIDRLRDAGAASVSDAD